MWLGLPDPVKSQKQARDEDPLRSAAREFIALWRDYLGTTKSYRTEEIIDAANEIRPIKDEKGVVVFDHNGKAKWEYVIPELQTLLIEQAGKGGAIDSKKLGLWLRSLKKQRHD